jgi:tRNA U34 5-carboxymethylaminomethyl modifying GTPase MnmE/TrmE
VRPSGIWRRWATSSRWSHARAIAALDELIGVVTPDDVLDRVFASFCVGK